MFCFHKKYFWWTVALFATEVFIGAYVHDSIVRPFGGDFLVVILLYCMVKSIINTPVWRAAVGVLLFSYLIETLQYLQLVKVLGLQHNRLASIIIGTQFAWEDMLAYTLGIALVLLLEKAWKIPASPNSLS